MPNNGKTCLLLNSNQTALSPERKGGYHLVLIDCFAGIDVGFINTISPAKETLFLFINMIFQKIHSTIAQNPIGAGVVGTAGALGTGYQRFEDLRQKKWARESTNRRDLYTYNNPITFYREGLKNGTDSHELKQDLTQWGRKSQGINYAKP